MKVKTVKKYIIELTEKQVIDLKTVLSEFAYSGQVPPGMTYSMQSSLIAVCNQLDLDSEEIKDKSSAYDFPVVPTCGHLYYNKNCGCCNKDQT